MLLALLIAGFTRASMGINQDPHDPLIFGPGVSIGSRLQYGTNVVPADWAYTGTLAEKSSQDDKLEGFHILTLTKPEAKPAPLTESFIEVPCDFIGTTPVVAVFSQDGEKHRFTIDTGAVHTYMRATMAATLNFGRIDPLPLCLLLPSEKWVHFKAEVNRSIAVLAAPYPDFPADGILGMNALACLQLKIDYKRRKLWARISSKPLDVSQVSSELTPNVKSKTPAPVVAVPIKRQDSGRYSIDVSFGDKTLPLELDTGANLIGLAPSTISTLTLEKVGEGQVLIENGTRPLSKYLAPEAKVGDVRFRWPVVHEGADPRADIGGFGPSVLPHQTVIIDYPGRRLYTLKPTEDELVEQAAGQLISGIVRILPNGVILDMPDIVGPSKAVLTKIQDHPAATVIVDLRLLARGDSPARSRLVSLYKYLSSPKGKITILQEGKEIAIEIGVTGR
jgi:hypothetical protein